MSKSVQIFKHLSGEPLTESEISDLARKSRKSQNEIRREIAHAIADLKYSQKEIQDTIRKNGYMMFPDKRVRIGDFGEKDEFNNYFLCHDKAEVCRKYSPNEVALVTGFGPTNSPTAGTLSVIFRLLEIQKKTKIYCHVIISDLGALNSRRKKLADLLKVSERFKRFIKKLGFDYKLGAIRTHNYFDLLRVASLTSSVLSVNDFEQNKEATEDMYERLKISGNDFSTMVDKNFTVADILLPAIRDRKKLVLVVAGLEEHYYPKLSRDVIGRLKKEKGGLRELVSHNPSVCAAYGKIIEGLFPYVKMSKSIPESSINIGNTCAEIKEKILNCGDRNEHVILQMMEVASDWNQLKIKRAKACFDKRKKHYPNWLAMKKEYCRFFLNVKKIWDTTDINKSKNIRKDIFY